MFAYNFLWPIPSVKHGYLCRECRSSAVLAFRFIFKCIFFPFLLLVYLYIFLGGSMHLFIYLLASYVVIWLYPNITVYLVSIFFNSSTQFFYVYSLI